MNKKMCAVVLAIIICISLVPNVPTNASSYEVKAYQSQVTTVVGYATYNLFYFYKDGKRIRTPKNVTYKSSNSSIVKVETHSQTAFFRGKKIGKATITCTYKGISSKITIIVKKMAADVNGWKNVCIPIGTSVYMNVESYNSKNIGNITLKSSNSSIAKLEKTKIEPFIWSDSVSYNGPEITAKKEGTAIITVKSKAGTEKLKIKVVPKLKLKVSKVTRKVTDGGYNFSFKITNKSDETVKVGGPVEVAVYRELYTASVNEDEKCLSKGKSATYTFFVPCRNKDDYVDDMIANVCIQYKGNSLLGYIKDDGSVAISSFMGKVPMNATIGECYLEN